MRIVILLPLVFLAACSHPQTEYVMSQKDPATRTAKGYCMSKGYVPGTFDYAVCYKNRPEIQAYERSSRLTTLAIINNNRSPAAGSSKSYPVE